MMNPQTLFLTFLGTGKLPSMRVAFAALLAIAVGAAIVVSLGMETLFMLMFAVSVISLFEINKYLAKHPESDGSEITVDDATGAWMSLMVALSTAQHYDISYIQPIAMALAFASFMLFQTWKPSTIGWMARKLKGGWGIVLSSLLSGMAGGLLSALIIMGMGRLF